MASKKTGIFLEVIFSVEMFIYLWDLIINQELSIGSLFLNAVALPLVLCFVISIIDAIVSEIIHKSLKNLDYLYPHSLILISMTLLLLRRFW